MKVHETLMKSPDYFIIFPFRILSFFIISSLSLCHVMLVEYQRALTRDADWMNDLKVDGLEARRRRS